MAAPDHHRAAREHLARGELEHAVRAWRSALLEDPEDLEAREGLGCALAKAGRHADAIEELDRVLRKDATRAVAQRARSEALMRLGRFDAAVEGLRAAMRLDGSEQGDSKERDRSR